jgi:hypothetical protein
MSPVGVQGPGCSTLFAAHVRSRHRVVAHSSLHIPACTWPAPPAELPPGGAQQRTPQRTGHTLHVSRGPARQSCPAAATCGSADARPRPPTSPPPSTPSPGPSGARRPAPRAAPAPAGARLVEIAVVQLHQVRRAPVAKVRAALAPADDQAVVERDRDGRVAGEVALHLRGPTMW